MNLGREEGQAWRRKTRRDQREFRTFGKSEGDLGQIIFSYMTLDSLELWATQGWDRKCRWNLSLGIHHEKKSVFHKNQFGFTSWRVNILYFWQKQWGSTAEFSLNIKVVFLFKEFLLIQHGSHCGKFSMVGYPLSVAKAPLWWEPIFKRVVYKLSGTFQGHACHQVLM